MPSKRGQHSVTHLIFEIWMRLRTDARVVLPFAIVAVFLLALQVHGQSSQPSNPPDESTSNPPRTDQPKPKPDPPMPSIGFPLPPPPPRPPCCTTFDHRPDERSPQRHLPFRYGEEYRQTLENYKNLLEKFRQGVEVRRASGTIDAEQYGESMKQYHDGISGYRMGIKESQNLSRPITGASSAQVNDASKMLKDFEQGLKTYDIQLKDLGSLSSSGINSNPN